jgi:large subunit ribosomal protein LP1
MPESAPLNRDELACVYAALIMIDDDVAVTADKINSVLKASKIQDVEPFWPGLFAKALEGVDGKQLITQLAGGFGGGGAVAAEPAAPAVVAAQAAPAAGKHTYMGTCRYLLQLLLRPQQRKKRRPIPAPTRTWD